ncbi:hypothetical protein PMAYCL1PPCAC_19384 [Pristionchus mayeri]|uniref:Uncharacterized protein n=1 Tax=Pristionchus mayeri TaxID=1317129 RepID=A0AAN5CRB4_9BILA|nr:hypothetical protein PMAYCL1PPCAC_19384 [Pristionchus mayeri]
MDPSLASSHYAETSQSVGTQTRRKALRSVTVQIIPASSSPSRTRPRRSLQVPSPIQEESAIPLDQTSDPPNQTVTTSIPSATALKDLVLGIVRNRLPLLGAALTGSAGQTAADAAQQETPVLNPPQAQSQPDGTNGAQGGTQVDWYQRWLETMGLVADRIRESELRWTRRAIFTASLFSLLSLVMICVAPPMIIYKLMRMRSELTPRVHHCLVHSVLFHHHLHHEYDDEDEKKRTLRETVERMFSSSRARRGTLIDVDDLIDHLQSGAIGGGE